RHTRFSRDWSADVCSSDLAHAERLAARAVAHPCGCGMPSAWCEAAATVAGKACCPGCSHPATREPAASADNGPAKAAACDQTPEIGRASCREGGSGARYAV